MFEVFDRKQVSQKENIDLWISDIREEEGGSTELLWVDLHVSPAGFKEPDPLSNRPWLPFERTKNGEPRFIRVDPGESVTLQTKELVRTGSDITGLVVGSAGRSLSGIQVVSGKVDPNFGPQTLALAIRNASDQAIWIKDGDKIAVIGFCRMNRKLLSEKIVGPAKAASDLLPTWLSRLIANVGFTLRKYRKVTIGVFLFYLFTVMTQAEVRSLADTVIEKIHSLGVTAEIK